MKTMIAMVDLQFGSCGKGLLAGYLAEQYEPDTIVTAWAPNAGHTYIDAHGNKYVNTALPNGIVSPKLRRILIGPGSVINPSAMMAELNDYAHLLGNVDVMIHEHAAVVNNIHRDFEAEYGYQIGSTMKGVGEAVIQKIRRNRADMNIAKEALRGTPLHAHVVSRTLYDAALDSAQVLMVEGAQGYSLSINQGFYPYVTSRECTLHQLFSDCSIPAQRVRHELVVWGVARTYPIRVANRYNSRGEQVGWSGPGYPDQKELEWKDIGVQPELTTVTKLPRRVFQFSKLQIQDAIRMNGVDKVFLNFCNYDQSANSCNVYEQSVACAGAGAPVFLQGYGPTVKDVREVAPVGV